MPTALRQTTQCTPNRRNSATMSFLIPNTPEVLAGVAAAIPWIYGPYNIVTRTRRGTDLDQESREIPPNAPLVSVIVPARNEAPIIEGCLSAILSNTYRNIEVIVVDDESSDGTGEIARKVAESDSRMQVISIESLPTGWLGKQWACVNGAKAAKGEFLCFTDADTLHGPELVARSVNCMERRKADVFSVFGHQEMRSFWELAIQPQVFVVIAARFGGTEDVTNSPRAVDKIANGQCLFVRQATYDAFGGHSLVREHVSDDIMIAQRLFERGAKVVLTHGQKHLSTRMYTSLETILGGWGKNIYAGFRGAMPYGSAGRVLFALVLLLVPIFQLAPLTVLAVAAFTPLPLFVAVWASIASASILVFWTVVYHGLHRPRIFAVLSPLGAAVTFFIFARAIIRRQRVVWKNREYVVE